MAAFIEPSLLQLVGLGTEGDPYLSDGRHLRWFMHRELGFPRSGFRLMRRRALAPWNEKVVLGLGCMRQQSFIEGSLSPVGPTVSGGVRFDNGLTLEDPGSLSFLPTPPFSFSAARLGPSPLVLGFGAKPPLPTGAARRDPAAYVMLVVVRREDTGWIQAKAHARGDSGSRLVDQGAVGQRLSILLPPALGLLTLDLAGTRRLLSAADRLHSGRELVLRNKDLSRSVAAMARVGLTRAPVIGPRSLPGIRPRTQARFVVDSILLHSGLIDRVEITGHDAALVAVQWIPTREYAELDGWEEVDTFRLPLTDHSPFYPSWTAQPGAAVAKDRLLHAPPQAMSPWDLSPHPPPADPAGVIQDQAQRYLGGAFTRLDRALREILAGEVAELKPQFQVETISEAQAIDQGDVHGAELVERLFDAVYASSVDPQLARVLGLMHSELVDAAELAGTAPKAWDYVVHAAFPALWVQRLTAPTLMEPNLDRMRGLLAGRFPPGRDGAPSPEYLKAAVGSLGATAPCLSMVTALQSTPTPLPTAPEDLALGVKAEPSMAPLKAEVRLSWARAEGNLFEDPQGAHLFYALRRKGDDGEQVLNRVDDDSGLRGPLVPSQEAEDQGRAWWIDRQLPAYGVYQWRLSAMGPFGRWSPYATVKGEVKDTLAPLPPATVSAELEGDAAQAPTWTTLELVFDWTLDQAQDAPDLDHFLVHLRQGDVRPVDAELPGSWGQLEAAPGQPRPPLAVPWPVVAGPLAAPVGIEATVSVAALGAELGGGHRITVRLGPVQSAFDALGFTRVSATATSVDTAGNESGPGRRVLATRADPGVPPPPPLLPGPQWSSRPDARARSFYRLDLDIPPATRAQVLRASQVALLSAAGTSQAAWEAMDLGQRVAHLKQAAMDHRSCFRPAHELPLDPSEGDFRLELNGNERGMTVVTVSRLGKTGTRTAWPVAPDFFAVVAVPRLAAPPRPLVDEARAADRSVSLRIQPDPTGRTVAFRVYRSRHADRLSDVRRMRPVAVLEVVAPAPGEAPAPMLWVDPSPAEWRTYGYRVVAVGEDGSRSEPTAPIFLRPWSTVAPVAPELVAVSRALAGGINLVRFLVPREDYDFELLRRPEAGLRWAAPVALDPASLAANPVAGGVELSFEDPLPVDQLGQRFAYRVRVRDPGGGTADSALLLEAP